MIRVQVSLRPRSLRPSRSRVVPLMAAALATLPLLALASPVGTLATFESGQPIVAADFNDNFDTIAEAVDDNDARIGALEGSSDGGVPTGAVVFFDASECPEGWAELTEARGRAVVGMNGSAATLLGTVGESLEDTEDRTHSHSVDVPAVASTQASVAHTHSVPAHSTANGGAHNHRWKDGTQSYNASGSSIPAAETLTAGGANPALRWTTQDLYTDSEAAHSHSVGAMSTGAASSTSHSHSVDPPSVASAAASTGNVMPYVQLLACRRS